MTLLQFQLTRLLGKPTRKGYDTWGWDCPNCEDKEKFSTLPDNGRKGYARCYKCGFAEVRGVRPDRPTVDIFDIMLAVDPAEKYPARLARVAAWEAEYKAGVAEVGTAAKAPVCNSPRGGGRVPKAVSGLDYGPTYVPGYFPSYSPGYGPGTAYENLAQLAAATNISPVREALGDLTEEELALVAKALNVVHEHGLPPAAVAHWLEYDQWVLELDAQHLAECGDPACDTAVCRKARGLPPLTREELAAGRREYRPRRRYRGGNFDGE